MDTAQPKFNSNLGAHIRGVVKSVQVVESRRLRQVRTAAFRRHGNADAFRNLHGMPFNGCYSHFMALSGRTRALIENDLVRDIRENAEAWEAARMDVAEVVEERTEKPNLFLSQGKNQILDGTIGPDKISTRCVVGTGTATPAASDVGLGTEVKRTESYLTGSGNCGTTYPSTGVRVFRRTYDFSIETVSQNYTELGFSYTSSSGNNLCSRLLISGGTVTVTIGQSLRVVYDLTFTVNASTGSGNLSMDEWGSVGATWGTCVGEIGNVDTNGLGNAAGTIFVPNNGAGWVIPVSGNFTFTAGSAVTGETALSSSIQGAWGTYTPGSFTRSLTFANYWSASAFNSTEIRGFIYGRFDQYGQDDFAIKFNSAQTKTNLQRLFANGLTLGYTT